MLDFSDAEAHILAANPNADTLHNLYQRCTAFDDKAHFAAFLNQCVKVGSISRRANKYYKGNGTPPAKDITPTVPRVAAAQALKRKKELTRKRKTKTNNGTLTPSCITGKVAYALFKYSEQFLLEGNLRHILNEDRRLRIILGDLCTKGYAYRRATLDGPSYRWSQKFDYPFARVLESDSQILVNTL